MDRREALEMLDLAARIPFKIASVLVAILGLLLAAPGLLLLYVAKGLDWLSAQGIQERRDWRRRQAFRRCFSKKEEEEP